jgi:hypothetical protein
MIDGPDEMVVKEATRPAIPIPNIKTLETNRIDVDKRLRDRSAGDFRDGEKRR